ncbi:MAG: FAD binding domain-containing protein [Candidatus Omnitrophica bacterium]|nr:FAD binding domain-containing protein [Candidatus Omnitrophota bacterium]
MLLNPFTFHAPKSLSQAVDLYSSLENVKLQAGGTFLLNNLKLLKRKGVKTPKHILSLKKAPELKGIFEEGGMLIIKAMTTMNELFDSPLLTGNMDVLKVAAKNIGTSQIRNMATVGGNLTCRYTWTEMPAIMVGLDADLYFTGQDGKQEILSAEEFFKASAKTDKIFTHAAIKKDPQALIAYRRVKKTPHLDIPLLSLLIKTNPDGKKFKNTRVAINNCVAFGQRDGKLESFIDQSTRSKTLAQEALNHLDEPIYDVRGSDYKKHISRVAIKDAIAGLMEKS